MAIYELTASDGQRFLAIRARWLPFAAWDEIDAVAFVDGFGWDCCVVRSVARLMELNQMVPRFSSEQEQLEAYNAELAERDEYEQRLNERDEMTSERKNIAEPSEWWAAFEAQAKKEGKTLSEWLGEAGLDKLPASVRKKLPERVTPGRPKNEE